MKKFLTPVLVTGLGALLSSTALAGSNNTYSPCTDTVVSAKSASKSATLTAGMISGRVSSVASGFTAAPPPVQTNLNTSTACGEQQQVLVLDEVKKPNTPTDGMEYNQTQHGIWTSGSANRIEKTDDQGRYDGNISNMVVGYDTRLTDDFIAGVALGYEKVDITTKYNSGKLESSAWTIAPYVGYIIDETFSVDASIGRTAIDYDLLRSSTISAKTDATRWFASANANAKTNLDNFILSGSAGYLWMKENQDGYTESNNNQVSKQNIHFGQYHLTGKVAYPFELQNKNILIPNAFARFEYDAIHEDGAELSTTATATTDPTGVVLGVGADLLTHNNMIFQVSGTTTQLRKNTKAYGLQATFRYNF